MSNRVTALARRLTLSSSVTAFMVLFSVVASAYADELCFDPRPVGGLTLVFNGAASGEGPALPLPLSPRRPDLLTKFQAALRWEPSSVGGATRVIPEFAFPDPGQVGLPYNIFRLSWVVYDRSGAIETRRDIDLTKDCTVAGLGIFPNQRVSFEDGALTVPDASGKSTVLTLWGERI